MSGFKRSTQNAPRKGRLLAAQMLREIERTQEDELATNPYTLDARFRYRGEAQENIVARYLSEASQNGDECVAGFCSALSDWISCTLAGCGNDGTEYTQITDRQIDYHPDALTREQVLREAIADESGKKRETGATSRPTLTLVPGWKAPSE